jgi:2-desacetyl-2-hydroxyethyl bacteriochlorophyllide A dehydrogenase
MASRIAFPAANQVVLEEVDTGDPGGGFVRVRTELSLMSTGTEGTVLRRRFDEGSHWALYATYPFYPGYAVVGVIDAVGPDVEELRPGQRVASRLLHASEQLTLESMCTPVPEEIESTEAVWFAFAKIALMGAQTARLRLGATVVVIGAGPIGQMATRWAVASGARHVVAVDGFASRLEAARRGGATAVAGALPSAAAEITEVCGGAPEVVIDSTGNAAVFSEALKVAADGGRVVLLGDTGSPQAQCLTPDVLTRGVRVVGAHDTNSMGGPAWDGDRSLHELFFDLVRRSRFDVRDLNTHTFTPSECAEAYDLATDQRGDTMGSLFDWTTTGSS